MVSDILLTLFFVFLNGFFVAAEFAIVKVRASQIELRVRKGQFLAKISQTILNHLDAYLSATQLGITLASLGLGWIGESVVASIMHQVLYYFGINLSPLVLHRIALITAFAMITVLHIVLGEQAPKWMAIQQPEKTTMFVVIPLRIFYTIFHPFIRVLNWLANGVVRLFGFQGGSDEHALHSTDELRYLLKESTESGLIDDADHQLIENVFEFADTPIRQIIVPRSEIVAIDIESNLDEIVDRVIEDGYSRIPVYSDSIDNIIGVIYAKDLIACLKHPNLFIIQDLIRPAFFVNEEDKIKWVLNELKRQKSHIAIVIDEFGGTSGIVTLEDIIEEIIGEIQDEYDEEEPMVENLTENEFTLEASVKIGDANEFLPVPLPERDEYETIGGLINNAIGRLPEINEEIELDNYTCIILEKSERKIEEVKLIFKSKPDKSFETN